MKDSYVVGLAFSHNKDKIALIRKKRPEWQAGYLNGIGGKIETKETPINAMVREFSEECGVTIETYAWREFAILHGALFNLHVFVCFDDKVLNACTRTDEEVLVMEVDLNLLRTEGVSNLTWLVAAALDRDNSRFRMDVPYRTVD